MGNPGPEYDGTRHNAGFLLADHLAARWHLGAFRRASDAREVRGQVRGQDVRLLKPWTFMNRSGAALAPLRSLAGFDPAADLLVLVDDYATPLASFRLRGAGSAGGHNGLKSVEGALRQQDYARLRIG
ncbi:MAG: aminoacyl-tRNA hydrolase, partial [Gemmatimonadota bacterium]